MKNVADLLWIARECTSSKSHYCVFVTLSFTTDTCCHAYWPTMHLMPTVARAGVWLYLSDLLLYAGSVRATTIMHRDLLLDVFRYPMVFFETSLKGQLLNRFAKDVDDMDTKMGQNVRTMLLVATKYVRTIVVICAVLPLFTVVIFPLSIVLTYMQVVILNNRVLRKFCYISSIFIYRPF